MTYNRRETVLIVLFLLCFNFAVGGWFDRHKTKEAELLDFDPGNCDGPECEAAAEELLENTTVAPEAVENIETKFYLYTRGNGDKGQVFEYVVRNDLVRNSEFKPEKEVKLVIHGFRSGCDRRWVQEIKRALLAVSDCNVICVDWSKSADRRNYLQAASSVEGVGKQTSDLIYDLRRTFDAGLKFHIIGFSLGAHVAGVIGRESGNIDRITGLDPAGPLFASATTVVRLDPTDAKFVDVIHTSGATLVRGGLGSMVSMGHVDFYPNGGRTQPGCPRRSLWKMVLGLGLTKRKNGSKKNELIMSSSADSTASAATTPSDGSFCNHKRAYKIYTESIKQTCQFVAYRCESFEKFLAGDPECTSATSRSLMGYGADEASLGFGQGALESGSELLSAKYFLLTGASAPYCSDHVLVQVALLPNRGASLNGKLEAFVKYAGVESETWSLLRSDEDQHQLPQTFSSLFPVPRPAANSNLRSTGPSITVTLKYQGHKRWFSRRGSSSSVLLGSVSVRFLESGQSWNACDDTSLLLNSGRLVTLELDNGSCYRKMSSA